MGSICETALWRPGAGHRISGKVHTQVAISNHRLQQVTDTDVLFTNKDYRDTKKARVMSLTHREFIRRFAQHILPLRFVRIRHYGIQSSTWKRGKLQSLQNELNVKMPEAKTKSLLRKCPSCKTGTVITIEVFGIRGPLKEFLTENQPAPVLLIAGWVRDILSAKNENISYCP